MLTICNLKTATIKPCIAVFLKDDWGIHDTIQYLEIWMWISKITFFFFKKKIFIIKVLFVNPWKNHYLYLSSIHICPEDG